jgi:hypothetical protein
MKKIIITSLTILAISGSLSHAKPGGWLLDIIKNNNVNISSHSCQGEYYRQPNVYYHPTPVVVYREQPRNYYCPPPRVMPMRPYQQNSFYFQGQPRYYQSW